MAGDPPPPGDLALIAASLDGARLVARLERVWPTADRYVLARYVAEAGPGAQSLEPPLHVSMPRLFARYRRLVFFLPVGAVVRLIAPCLKDKLTDPAVVAVDDGGRFAVSLLSGHAGGGNALASAVADLLGAQAVITTAVERRGGCAPELIGREYGWRLEATREALLRASAALANGQPLAVYQDAGQRGWLGEHASVRLYERLADLAAADPEAAIVVTDRELPAALAERCVVWRPRWLVAGLGCSSGAPFDEVEALLCEALAQAGFARGGLRRLATLDRKLAEPALQRLAARWELDLVPFSSAELACVAVPNPSEVVRGAVGTPSVAEAAALLASGGYLVATKRASAHATVALAYQDDAS